MMVTFHFDTTSRLADIALSLDLPAMRRDWATIGSDEALFNFAADKLSFALAGQYGTPTLASPTCSVAAQLLTDPCTLQWRDTHQVIQLQRIPTDHRLRILYLPPATTL